MMGDRGSSGVRILERWYCLPSQAADYTVASTMRSNRSEPARQSIEIEIEGKRYAGTYWVERGMITVRYLAGHVPDKKTQVGGSSPESLARIMLRELVADAAAAKLRQGRP